MSGCRIEIRSYVEAFVKDCDNVRDFEVLGDWSTMSRLNGRLDLIYLSLVVIRRNQGK